MYCLLECRINRLRSRRPRLPSKIPSRPVTIVSVQPEISPILKDNLSLSLPLLLVFLNLLIFVNTIHKPTHIPYRLLGQRFSQIMLDRQVDLKSPYSHIIKVPINLIEHLLVSIQVRFQGLLFSHGHGQQGIQGPRNSNAQVSFLKESMELAPRPSKPPHRHRPQARQEYFTHQGLILGVHSHSLVEVAYMLHRVCLTIVHGEHGLGEPPRKSPSLNSACKR